MTIKVPTVIWNYFSVLSDRRWGTELPASSYSASGAKRFSSAEMVMELNVAKIEQLLLQVGVSFTALILGWSL